MSKNKIRLIAFIFFVFLFLISFNFVFAQETGQQCVAETGDCTEQGLFLASLLENRGLSFALVALAGLIDGVNPCAIGMLILLLGYLLVFAHESKRMVKLGLIYILTVFITYYLIGILFSQIVYQITAWPFYQQVSDIIKYVIIGLIWLAALINIKDVFFYGKWFSLGVSKSEVPVLMKLIKKVDWPATILLGVVVTIFELPCSLPVYLGAIGIMTETFTFAKTALYLLVYNLMFVLPLIVVFSIIVRTHHIFEAKDIQERANKWMKLSMAIAQILIGIGLLLI